LRAHGEEQGDLQLEARHLTHVLWLAALVALLCGAACGDADDKPSGETPATTGEPAPPASARAAPSAADGAKLVEKLECNRCHMGTAQLEPPDAKQCFGCHVGIASGKMPKAKDGSTPAHDPKLLAGWKKNVEHLRFAPSLSGIGKIVDPGWVERYLLAPHDLRPGLHAGMPRLPIGEPEAAAIAAYFAEQARFDGEAGAGSPQGDAGRGRTLFSTKGCAGCHTFSGARTDPPPLVKPRDRTARSRPTSAFRASA
jgi:cytochrome c5